MRFTIERVRTLVLVSGVLLAAAILAFLGIGRWKRHLNLHDALKPLGANIEQTANGFEYTQSHGGHTLFKIRASKVVELTNHHAELHDVTIELYGTDGGRVDRIEGSEFEYDQEAGLARAAGPVEITLMRPGVAPAIAPHSAQAAVGSAASAGEIRVKTSGLTFNQKTGVATTSERVDFSVTQGTGSALGATYDSQQGRLVLDSEVALNERRGREPVLLHAAHAEFERGDLECDLRAATADYRGGRATAGAAKILFRDDGSAVRLDATGGFTIETATGAHVQAPAGRLEFNDESQPRSGLMQGGVIMDSATKTPGGMRQVRESSPTAALEFSPQGELRQAHLERGVVLESTETSAAMTVSRTWRSPVADVEFRSVSEGGKRRIEPATIRGMGDAAGSGVSITGLTQRANEPPQPSKLYADEVTGVFGADSALKELIGTGHAGLEETTEAGARQTATGDRLVAELAPRPAAGAKTAEGPAAGAGVESATLEGHVVLVDEPAASGGGPTPAPIHATAGRADYDGARQLLHLTLSPRVDDGGLQMTADRIDVSQASGDAFAHGDVKATWLGAADGQSAHKSGAAARGAVGLGGSDPAHVIAAEAELRRATGEATFRWQARLWQAANSVSAPVIVLNRTRETLVARGAGAAQPVSVVLLSGGGEAKESGAKARAPSVIRLRGADLKYSDAERKAAMHGGAGPVTAETATATTSSDDVELTLLPAGTRGSLEGGSSRVDRMTARGHVVVNSEGRRGSGEQLVYTSETGDYVLTGSGAAPPRMTDPARGVVSGEALIFHGRDDSVSIEGGGGKTTTETRTPK